MAVVEIAEWVVAGGVLAAAGGTFLRSALGVERRAQLRLLARRRARRAEQAAVEASIDDPAFTPEAIRSSVKTIVALAASAGDETEPRALRSRRDAALVRAWGRRARERFGEFIEPAGDPAVDVLRIVNRESEQEDRVVARVRVKLARDARRSRNLPGDQTVLAARHVSIEERWTLARHGEEWFLVSLADDPLSAAVMSAPLITSPLDDDERLREAGLRELSAADASRADAPRPAELADRDVPAPQELRDLAVADGRFDPALLEATIRHVVDAWEQSSDGVGQPLAQVAGKNAIRALQYPGGPGGRRFIRDAALRRWEVTAINQVAERPTVRVAVKLRAAVYRGDGRHFSGSDRRRRKLDLVWTLRFDADAANEPGWRLLDSADA